MPGKSAFNSPRLLLSEAREKIDDLEQAIKDFIRDRPPETVSECDLETRTVFYKVRLLEEIPPAFSLRAFDIVNYLRSALDHAVYASAATLGKGVEPKSTKFPAGDDQVQVEGDIVRNCKDVHPEIASLLSRCAPHKEAGGNFPLWALNKLRNVKVHRLLVPSAGGGTRRISGPGIFLSGSIAAPPYYDPEKFEVIVLSGPAQFTALHDMTATLRICFGEVEGVGGKEITGTLTTIANAVDRVVADLEAETARLAN